MIRSSKHQCNSSTTRAKPTLPTPARKEMDAVGRELTEVRGELAHLPAQRMVYAGTVHNGTGTFTGTGANGGKPRDIHVLGRGDVKKPGKRAEPGTVGVIKDLPSR